MKMKSNFFNDSKNSGRVIVLLHGLLSSHSYWTELQAILNKSNYRTISIDSLGFGEAPKPKDIEYNYDDQIGFIKNTLESLDVKTDITFIGHSAGSLIATRFALKYPELTNQLVLLNPPIYTSREAAHEGMRSINNLYRFILDSKYRGPVWLVLRLISKGSISKHTKLSREKTINNIIESAEFIADINRVTAPTLLVNGLQDRPEYHESLNLINNQAHVTIKEIDSGHHPVVFNLNTIEPIIRDFIQSKPSHDTIES